MRRPTCFRRNVLDNPDSRARSTTCDAARLFEAGADPYSETGRVRPVEKQGRSSRTVMVRRIAVTAGHPDPAVATIGNSHNCAGSAVRYQTGYRYPRVAVEALPPSDQPRTPALPSRKGKLPWPARTDVRAARQPNADRCAARSAPPLRIQQKTGRHQYSQRSRECPRTPVSIRKTLRHNDKNRDPDMPRHRFTTGPGKTAPLPPDRGAHHHQREQHNSRGDRPTDTAHQFHDTTDTPVARFTSFSNCATSVVHSPSAIVLLSPW